MYKLSFEYNGEEVKFERKVALSLYTQFITWLYNNGYKFDGVTHEPFVRRPHTKREVKSSQYKNDFVQVDDSDIYLYRCGNISKLYRNITLMLKNFGIDLSLLKSTGFETSEVDQGDDVIPFSKFSKHNIDDENKIVPFVDLNSQNKSLSYVTNPFIQSICILGDPGVGKSVTAIDILESDPSYKFHLEIPTDLSTSMLVQFLRGELKLNKVSKMIIEAYKNPSIKYTVLIDEFHKPLTSKRVNDELLQAISTKRYRENRFIVSAIADDFISEELIKNGFEESDFNYHGNIKLPLNFGFILLSSKPSVIVENDDIYDRIDIVYLTSENQGKIKNVNDLLNMRIHEKSDKAEFREIIREDDRTKLVDFLKKFNP